MVLAAGRGERMRPLTDHCPKPLLPVHGKPLVQWALEALLRGGCTRAVLNTAWLGEQLEATFSSQFALDCAPINRVPTGEAEHMHLLYSHEGRDFGAALETAGGIARALPLLCPGDTPGSTGTDIFWVLAGDVFAPDFVFSPGAVAAFADSDRLAHLWLVPNPDHNPRGDFGFDRSPQDPAGGGYARSLAADDPRPRYTYSTIGLYRAALFAPPWCDIAAGNPLGVKAALAPLLRAAMAQSRVSAEIYTGRWTDVGTPQRLQQLNATTDPDTPTDSH